MLSPVVGILLAVAAATSTQESDGIRVTTTVRAQIYTFTVANVDAAPIMSVELDHGLTYPPIVPDGWMVEDEDGHLRAWTEAYRRAIGPGESADFLLRTTSSGSTLGLAPVTVGLRDGTSIEIADVWTPQRRPRVVPLLAQVTLASIVLMHAGLVAWRTRRA